MSGPRKPFLKKDWDAWSTLLATLLIYHLLTLLSVWLFGEMLLSRHAILGAISSAILLLFFYIRRLRSESKFGRDL